ncbi:hypothetical protein CLV40_119142 [Actinokineospora auranticolor]|uniref:Uncharacterized protein n=1 Tax=Actinokineospora auranticolor TaxID=155976 RepID=A0A2S6GH94_9PSEU|nr:hypothetical protein CLV40_119142 [Actinokineospora auranticolor]
MTSGWTRYHTATTRRFFVTPSGHADDTRPDGVTTETQRPWLATALMAASAAAGSRY